MAFIFAALIIDVKLISC